MDITKEQALEMVWHGSVTLDTGQVLRFREEPDNDTRINDFDCLGKVAPIGRWEYQPKRPEGFDGMAEKVHTQGDSFWWQPPADLREGWVTSPLRDTLRQSVQDILDYGFRVFTVELCDGENAYGDLIVVDYASLGGVEPFMSADDTADYLMDLCHEIRERETV